MPSRGTNRSRGSGLVLVALALVASLALVAGCGGDGGDGGDDSTSGPQNMAAPAASDFPSAQGKTLKQVLSEASAAGPVVSPAGQVLRVGDNRFSFGVFTPGRDQITDAKVAVYAAPGSNLTGQAIGPFPARIESLATEPAFRAKTTTDDPDAALAVYVSDVSLDKPGPWAFGALVLQDDGSYQGSLIPTPSKVGQFNPVDVGDKAPVVSTPTANDVADISEIDTRIPPSGDLHDEDLADALGKKPVVLLFATPALCQSRVCGPVVDVTEQVKSEYGDEVAFIFSEVYRDNDINKGPRPQMTAYGLQTEPWVFVIDRNGIVRTAIEGAFSVDELEQAVAQVAS